MQEFKKSSEFIQSGNQNAIVVVVVVLKLLLTLACTLTFWLIALITTRVSLSFICEPNWCFGACRRGCWHSPITGCGWFSAACVCSGSVCAAARPRVQLRRVIAVVWVRSGQGRWDKADLGFNNLPRCRQESVRKYLTALEQDRRQFPCGSYGDKSNVNRETFYSGSFEDVKCNKKKSSEQILTKCITQRNCQARVVLMPKCHLACSFIIHTAAGYREVAALTRMCNLICNQGLC